MLRIGLFGAGRIGRMHAKNLAAHDRVELVGIYDVDSDASAAAAAQTGSVSVDSVEDLLGDDALDAVMIASSTSTHCVEKGQSPSLSALGLFVPHLPFEGLAYQTDHIGQLVPPT